MLPRTATPFSPEVVADPFSWYRWLHTEGPRVHHCPVPGLYVLSRYDDVAAALRDNATYSSAEGVTFLRLPLGMMITCDPPDHTRLRKIVSRHFTPAAIEARRPLIERRVDEFLTPILERGSAEIIGDLAMPMPVAIIADILGVDAEDRAAFREWSDKIVKGFYVGAELDQQTIMEAGDGFLGLGGYFAKVAAERRSGPADDLVSLLLRATDDELMSPGELTSFFVLLLVAGNETTTNLISSLIYSLIEHPGQWRLLRDEPKLIGPAIEEALRYRSPIQGLYRTTTRDVELHGVLIPKGSRVLMAYGAANRDPRRFTDPDVFDITRDPNDHLGFGAGIHFCLGAALSRLEARMVMERLVAAGPELESSGEAVLRENPNLYGLAELPIRLG